MENFLTFLSNNYIYFLIAAGVLFFALIGFLFDLKKKKEESNDVPDLTSIPDVTSIPEDMNLEEAVDKNGHIDNQTEGVVEEFNPAPPMPQEEVIESMPVNNETLNVNSAPIYTEPVQSQEIPVQPQEPTQNIETVNSNDQINQ